jgi:hypothetical protein
MTARLGDRRWDRGEGCALEPAEGGWERIAPAGA